MVLIIMKKTVIFGSLLLLSTASFAGLYRWVDDAGKVHYSDKMSATVSKKAHAELSENGLVKKNVNPEAEIQLAKQRKHELALLELEKRKQQELRLKHKKELEEKQKHDKFLLTTYVDKDELVHYFENKIKQLKGNTRILKAQSDVLQKKIARLEASKKKVKDKKAMQAIDKKIVRIQSSINQYQKAMESNAQELIVLNKNYQEDYKRFSELSKK